MWCLLFKQKTAYELRISDWSSDVCASDLPQRLFADVDAAICQAARDRAIGGEMLGAGEQAVVAAQIAALKAAHAGGGEEAAEGDVRPCPLHHQAPELAAGDVDNRREGEVQARRRGLQRHGAGGALGERGIEDGRYGEGNGAAGHKDTEKEIDRATRRERVRQREKI